MKFRLLALVSIALTTIIAFWLVRHIKHRRIATALLAFHHQWETNSYRSTKMPLPKILAEQGDVHASSAGILGAYVEYGYQEEGVEWTRRFHILRANTNATTWTLSEFTAPKDTNLLQKARKRKLVSVKREP